MPMEVTPMIEDRLLYDALMVLAEKREIQVIEEHLPESLSQRIKGLHARHWKGTRDLILINKSLSLEQKLLTLAHELAHHQLHNDGPTGVHWPGTATAEPLDAEADHYADRLLSYVRHRLKCLEPRQLGGVSA